MVGVAGGCKCVFAEGPFYGEFQNMGPPSKYGIVNGNVVCAFLGLRRTLSLLSVHRSKTHPLEMML